ncbi:MAG TPA: S41 family peptidase [Candidatus Limnocylindrales bacterium]|nr:S41 family peptidase [Candidatus Limnocylindrales bacterium]
MTEKGSKKRGFFTQPLGIAVLVLLAFGLGNAFGAGRFPVGAQQSEFKAVSGLPEQLNYSQVDDVYDVLRNNYDGKLTEEQIINGLKEGLAKSTNDPYTEYYTQKEAKEFQSQIDNSFSGIGAELGKDKDDNLIIVSPIAGFPAERAGIRVQDIVASINDESTSGLSIDEAVKKIRGEKGTTVKLQIIRNKSAAQTFTITRENIQVPSAKHEIVEDNIGYLTVSTFSNDTADLVSKAANEFRDKGVQKIVLDLRGNPGGRLEQAVEVAGQWLPAGKTVLTEKRGDVTIKAYQSTGPATLQGIPTVVLIDEGSASASEIVAGALRDNKAARLIGMKSYGKGVVQQTICVAGPRQADGSCNGDMLKVTIASWFRPSGENIHKKGIKPDQEVKLSEADIEAKNDKQRQAALDYLNR